MQAGVGQELCILFMDCAGSASNTTCLRLVQLFVFVLLVGKTNTVVKLSGALHGYFIGEFICGAIYLLHMTYFLRFGFWHTNLEISINHLFDYRLLVFK